MLWGGSEAPRASVSLTRWVFVTIRGLAFTDLREVPVAADRHSLGHSYGKGVLGSFRSWVISFRFNLGRQLLQPDGIAQSISEWRTIRPQGGHQDIYRYGSEKPIVGKRRDLP